MTTFSIDVQDQAVHAALGALSGRINNLGPVLRALGEDIVEDAKHRFETSSGPDGQRWAPNTRATIEAYIRTRGGFGKRGINKKGQGLAISKKPLIGESGDLRRQIFSAVAGNELTVGASPVYAAMQQFGGTKAKFPNLRGDIPARPFLPVKQDGSLYPQDRDRIVETLQRYIARGL